MDKVAKRWQREEEARLKKAEREREKALREEEEAGEEELYDSDYWEKKEKAMLRALQQKGEENWDISDWSAYLGRMGIRVKDTRQLKTRMSQMPLWDVVEMWVMSRYDEELDDLGVGAFAEKKSFRSNEDAEEFCNGLSYELDAFMECGFSSDEAARACLEYSTGAKGAQEAANEFYNFMTIYGSLICLSGKFSISTRTYKAAIRKEGGNIVDRVTTNTNFLVIGEKPGLLEMKDAFRNGVTICCEYSLYEALGMEN